MQNIEENIEEQNIEENNQELILLNQGQNEIQNVSEEEQIIYMSIEMLKYAAENAEPGQYYFREITLFYGASPCNIFFNIPQKKYDDNSDGEDEDHFNNNIHLDRDQNDDDLGMIAEEMMSNLQHVFTGFILTFIYGAIVLPLLEKVYSNAYSNVDDNDNNIKDQTYDYNNVDGNNITIQYEI